MRLKHQVVRVAVLHANDLPFAAHKIVEAILEQVWSTQNDQVSTGLTNMLPKMLPNKNILD